MSQFTGFFTDLKTSFDGLSQSIQSFLDTISVITSFLRILFSIVPLDLFLVLVFSLFLVFLFNTISPNTARINYTLGVLLASIGRSFFHNAVSQTWNVGPVSLGAFYLLLPAYSTFLLRFLLGVAIRSYKRKNALNPKTLEQALSNVQKTFHGLMAEGHRELSKLGSDPILDRNVLKKSLEELELTVSGLKRVLDDTSKE